MHCTVVCVYVCACISWVYLGVRTLGLGAPKETWSAWNVQWIHPACVRILWLCTNRAQWCMHIRTYVQRQFQPTVKSIHFQRMYSIEYGVNLVLVLPKRFCFRYIYTYCIRPCMPIPYVQYTLSYLCKPPAIMPLCIHKRTYVWASFVIVKWKIMPSFHMRNGTEWAEKRFRYLCMWQE